MGTSRWIKRCHLKFNNSKLSKKTLCKSLIFSGSFYLLYSYLIKLRLILFENQNYLLLTCLDELKFYRRLRFLGYFWFSLSISFQNLRRFERLKWNKWRLCISNEEIEPLSIKNLYSQVKCFYIKDRFSLIKAGFWRNTNCILKKTRLRWKCRIVNTGSKQTRFIFEFQRV